MCIIVELTGELHGHLSGIDTIHVGAFSGPRVTGHPAAWTTVSGSNTFRLCLPPGAWYIHAVGGSLDRRGFLNPTVWGSHGGIYGLGSRVESGPGPLEPVRLHVSHLWRDLTHVPFHQQPALTDDQRQAVQGVIAQLTANPALTALGELGAELGLARTRLSALFRRATGLTMEEYRSRLRLEAAKALLVTTNESVLAIALEVGYSSPTPLARLFQQHLGLTPTEFRQAARAAMGEGPEPPTPRCSPTLLGRLLARFRPQGGTIRGEVIYRGSERGVVVYVAAFPNPVPDGYPGAWTALPAPGPFTLHHVPPGLHYLLAVYCRRRMLYPGDFHTAFAYGGYGDLDTTGSDEWEPIPVTVQPGETRGGFIIPIVDGDRAAGYARPWFDAFLPDGR